MKMPFGKYKGKDIKSLSHGYCTTLLENVPIKDVELKKALVEQAAETEKDLIREYNYMSLSEWDDDCDDLDHCGLDFGDLC